MPRKPKTHAQKAHPKRPRDERPSAARRGYGATWQRLRRLCLNRDPLCVECRRRGFTEPAVHADHIVPLSAGGSNALSNLQGLCAMHHSQKTGKERAER